MQCLAPLIAAGCAQTSLPRCFVLLGGGCCLGMVESVGAWLSPQQYKECKTYGSAFCRVCCWPILLCDAKCGPEGTCVSEAYGTCNDENCCPKLPW